MCVCVCVWQAPIRGRLRSNSPRLSLWRSSARGTLAKGPTTCPARCILWLRPWVCASRLPRWAQAREPSPVPSRVRDLRRSLRGLGDPGRDAAGHGHPATGMGAGTREPPAEACGQPETGRTQGWSLREGGRGLGFGRRKGVGRARQASRFGPYPRCLPRTAARPARRDGRSPDSASRPRASGSVVTHAERDRERAPGPSLGSAWTRTVTSLTVGVPGWPSHHHRPLWRAPSLRQARLRTCASVESTSTLLRPSTSSSMARPRSAAGPSPRLRAIPRVRMPLRCTNVRDALLEVRVTRAPVLREGGAAPSHGDRSASARPAFRRPQWDQSRSRVHADGGHEAPLDDRGRSESTRTPGTPRSLYKPAQGAPESQEVGRGRGCESSAPRGATGTALGSTALPSLAERPERTATCTADGLAKRTPGFQKRGDNSSRRGQTQPPELVPRVSPICKAGLA